MPFSHDQPDNANRLVGLGVAARLDPRRCTPHALNRALDGLLDPQVRERCTRYATRIDLEGAVQDAAAFIEAAAGR